MTGLARLIYEATTCEPAPRAPGTGCTVAEMQQALDHGSPDGLGCSGSAGWHWRTACWPSWAVTAVSAVSPFTSCERSD